MSYRSTWSVWRIRINLIRMRYTDHVDPYECTRGKTKTQPLKEMRSLPRRCNNKTELQVLNANNEPPNVRQKNLQGKQMASGGEEARASSRKQPNSTRKRNVQNAWTVLDVQVLYFKWKTFLLIYLKCWMHLVTPLFKESKFVLQLRIITIPWNISNSWIRGTMIWFRKNKMSLPTCPQQL